MHDNHLFWWIWGHFLQGWIFYSFWNRGLDFQPTPIPRSNPFDLLWAMHLLILLNLFLEGKKWHLLWALSQLTSCTALLYLKIFSSIKEQMKLLKAHKGDVGIQTQGWISCFVKICENGKTDNSRNMASPQYYDTFQVIFLWIMYLLFSTYQP